jgi:hypothetical protein
MFKKLTVLLISVLMVIACSKSIDSEKTRFNMAKDKLDVIASQNPMLKVSIATKMAEFQAEYQSVIAGNTDDEAKIKALSSLNYRVSQYTTQIEPKKPASKLNQTTTTTTPVVVPPVGTGLGSKPATNGLGVQPTTNGLGTQPATNGLGTQPATNGLGTQPATNGLGTQPATNGLGTQPATNGLGTSTTPALDNLGKKTDTSSVPALDGLGKKTTTTSVPALDSKMGTSPAPTTKPSKLQPPAKKPSKLK